MTHQPTVLSINTHDLQSYQSSNQLNFYSANIPCVARLSGSTSKSVLSSKINEAVPQRQQVIGHAGVYGGKARSKRCVLRHFTQVETEVYERIDSGKLFQGKGAQELNDISRHWSCL